MWIMAGNEMIGPKFTQNGPFDPAGVSWLRTAGMKVATGGWFQGRRNFTLDGHKIHLTFFEARDFLQ
jgi:hypothetical protein